MTYLGLAGAYMLGRLSPHQTASVSKAVPVMILDASADIEINRRIWSTDLGDETDRIERNTQRDDAVAPAEADARAMMRVAPT